MGEHGPTEQQQLAKEFQEWFVPALKASGHNQTSLARALDVTPQAVSNWARGEAIPDLARIHDIAVQLECDPFVLLRKTTWARRMPPLPSAAMSPSEQRKLEEEHNIIELDKLDIVGQVPLISWVAAGAWSEAADPYAPGAAERWVSVTERVGRRAFALRVRGDSMLPEFPSGCIIVVDPDSRPAPGHFVVARNDDWDEATLKQYVVESGIPYLKPLNPAYQTVQVAPGTRIVGVVRQMLRTFGDPPY